MSYTTVPTPIPPNTNFSLYYTSTTLPDIQPPDTTFQLIKQGDSATVYNSFSANTSITTSTLLEPFFFTRDSQDNIYYTTWGFDGSGSQVQIYLLDKNGTSGTIPTVAIS